MLASQKIAVFQKHEATGGVTLISFVACIKNFGADRVPSVYW
jgi:hypothetical protein